MLCFISIYSALFIGVLPKQTSTISSPSLPPEVLVALRASFLGTQERNTFFLWHPLKEGTSRMNSNKSYDKCRCMWTMEFLRLHELLGETFTPKKNMRWCLRFRRLPLKGLSSMKLLRVVIPPNQYLCCNMRSMISLKFHTRQVGV